MGISLTLSGSRCQTWKRSTKSGLHSPLIAPGVQKKTARPSTTPLLLCSIRISRARLLRVHGFSGSALPEWFPSRKFLPQKTERPGLARPHIGWRRHSASAGHCPHPSNQSPLGSILIKTQNSSMEETLHRAATASTRAAHPRYSVIKTRLSGLTCKSKLLVYFRVECQASTQTAPKSGGKPAFLTPNLLELCCDLAGYVFNELVAQSRGQEGGLAPALL